MFPVFSRLAAVFCCISCVCVCAEKVPGPQNVRVLSEDMGLVLEWDPPKHTSNKLFNYTAEVKGWSDFEPVCLSTSSVSCDFTLNVTSFGIYSLRVRSEFNGESSEWVKTVEFTVDNITKISHPHVELRSKKGQIEVDITDPPMRTKNLRDVYGSISYLIRFWKKGEVTKEELIREQNRVMLPQLEPLATYCVQVAVLYMNVNKTSKFSNVTCVTNTASDEVQHWVIAVALLVSFLVVLLAVVLVFLAVWYSYKVCRFIYPDAKLPEDLKQYLSERPQSSTLSVLQPKESFSEVSILQEDTHNTPHTQEPVRTQTNKTSCKDHWTAADMKFPDEDEEQRLLDEMRL